MKKTIPVAAALVTAALLVSSIDAAAPRLKLPGRCAQRKTAWKS